MDARIDAVMTAIANKADISDPNRIDNTGHWFTAVSDDRSILFWSEKTVRLQN